MDDVLKLLGLAYRAGKLILGEEVLRRIRKVRLLFLASDISEGSRERGAPALSSSRLTALSQPHTEILFVPPHGTKCSTPWDKVFHPMEQMRSRHLSHR